MSNARERRYQGHENVSDLKPGSAWEHIRANDEQTVEPVGKVPRELAADPSRYHLGKCFAV